MPAICSIPESSSVRAALAHRGGLTANLRSDPTLFARIGGRSVVGRIIDGLYHRIEKDAGLRPMFTRTLASERMKQKALHGEWMGGEPVYTRHHAYGGIKSRHGHIHITRESAQRWLMHMTASLRDNGGEAARRGGSCGPRTPRSRPRQRG